MLKDITAFLEAYIKNGSSDVKTNASFPLKRIILLLFKNVGDESKGSLNTTMKTIIPKDSKSYLTTMYRANLSQALNDINLKKIMGTLE